MERFRLLVRGLSVTSWLARNHRSVAILALTAIALASVGALIEGPDEATVVPVAVIALLSVLGLLVMVWQWILR